MNEELLKKVRKAGSVDEIISLAEKNGMAISHERAAEIFAKFSKSGELGDDDLDSVSGGACISNGGESSPKYSIGQTVTWNWSMMHCPKDGESRGEVISCRIATSAEGNSSFEAYRGTVIYTVKCPKCGSVMEVPELWLQ